MIRHIVLLRFNDTVTDADLDAIDAGLSVLPAQIPTIRSYTVGRDLRLMDGSWDYGIVADFDSADDWRVYDTDDEHNRVRREIIAPFLADRASVRFDLSADGVGHLSPYHALEVRRDDLGTHRVVAGAVPEITEGQALLRVDRFGLTANNITYGVAGDMIGYWQFFPPADEGWGRIPVWGFADVVESRAAGVVEGDRIFGYYPMATHLVVEPRNAGEAGFTDASAHRAALPAAYNGYRFAAADPIHRPETEGHQMVFWPLFMTGFLIADFLTTNADFGAGAVVLSSASSKTALSTAFCLAGRKASLGDGAPEIIGLTSAGNVAFVEGLGCYDRVVTYDDVATLDAAMPTVFVDMAGDPAVRSAVHHHYADALRYSCAVGITHWQEFGTDGGTAEPLPGPAPELFFAPNQANWSDGGFQERFGAAWGEFLAAVDGWITLTEVRGPEATAALYDEMLAGRARPDIGYAVSLHP